MKQFFFCLVLLLPFSCTNSEQTESDNAVGKTEAGGYLKEDIPFIQKADDISRTIDVENIFEYRKDEISTDLDGQQYPFQYMGYSKRSSDSVAKIIVNGLFGGKNSAKSTLYYYNGNIIKGITEIFAEDTVRCTFYYDADKMIYPQEEGMEKAAQKLRDKSIGLKTIFIPDKESEKQ
jgi:hypothetical protein